MNNSGDIRDYLLEQKKRRIPQLVSRELNVGISKKRATTIIGPRRAGKTSFLYQIMKSDAENSMYVNFEDTRLMGINFKDIRAIVRAYTEISGKEPSTLLLDEIQNVEGWEHAVRELLDTLRYKIYITGSSSRLLSREIATSMRGRTLVYLLLPFSFREYLSATGVSADGENITRDEIAVIKNKLNSYVEYGGFPEVVFDEEKERILKQYYEMILFKDIVERHSLKNITLSRFLLSHFTQNFSKEMSINKICGYFSSQGHKFPRNTVYEYVDKMQDSVAIFFVNRFTGKSYLRESWPKKVYLCDTGLSRVAKFSMDEGKLCENTVFLHLLRHTNIDPLHEVYYYRSVDDKEVDFVIRKGSETIKLIQSCYNLYRDPDTMKREFSSLAKASEELRCDDLTCVTWDQYGQETYKNKIIKLTPLWKFLLNHALN